MVRDLFLSDESEAELRVRAKTDQPYTEVKWEAAIDRVTSAATPRQIERVPAGARFDGMELVFSIYEPGDRERFIHVLEAMQLLQDDYLGGLGSRGSGKVVFENLSISVRSRQNYGREITWPAMPEPSNGRHQVSLILDDTHREGLIDWLKEQILCEPYGT
jgi:CRISPR-associated protein Csm3